MSYRKVYILTHILTYCPERDRKVTKMEGKTDEMKTRSFKEQALKEAERIGAKITAKGRRIIVVFSEPCVRYDAEGNQYEYIEANEEYHQSSYSGVLRLLISWTEESEVGKVHFFNAGLSEIAWDKWELIQGEIVLFYKGEESGRVGMADEVIGYFLSENSSSERILKKGVVA